MRKTNRKKIIIILNVTENFKLLKKKKKGYPCFKMGKRHEKAREKRGNRSA